MFSKPVINYLIDINIKISKYFIILFFFVPIKVYGTFDLIQNGFGLDIGKSGSGFFLLRQYTHSSERFSFLTELRFYDIKGENEMFAYDYFTGQYRSIGSKSLVYVPVFFGASYYPFVGLIANNFSPFITYRLGPVLTIDGKEEGSFLDRWSNPDTDFSYGGFLGVGIEFKWINLSSIILNIGYDYFPPPKSIGRDYSGFLIHIAFNRSVK